VPFQEEGDEAVHRYLLIQLRVGRGETTWQSLTKAERREMKEVVRLWRSAADKGHAQSQYNLGVIYRHGQGVAQDLTETRRLYHLSAEQGCRDARMNLALMYQNGLGVASNDVEAYKWYLAAAEDGDAGACYSVGVYFDETSSWHGGVEKKDSAKAFEWYEKAALQGDSNAQHNLGYMLASGFGKKQDMVGAAKWLRLAADQGNDEAQFMLAQVYAGGQGGLEKSEEKAAKLYALSAKQGNFNAKMALKLLREPRSGSLTSAESIAQELVRAAMLSTKPPHSASLQVGSRVVLHSLTTRPELNGATGVVTSAKNESGRIGVQLDNGGKPFMLKNGNLDSIETKELLPLSAVAAKKADFDAASTAALETFPPHYLEMAWNTGADSGSLNTSMTGQKYPSIALLPPKLASMRVAFEKDCHDGWVKATATALVCADHSKPQCAQCSGWL
jgi:TPR repeat protein